MKKWPSHSDLSLVLLAFLIGLCNLDAQILNQPAPASNPNLGGNTPWTAACASDSFNEFFVNFTWNPPLVESDNQFILELSDTTGNFANPLVLDSANDRNTIFDFEFSFQVPNDLPPGNYRFRVRSTNPAKVSPPSDTFPFSFIGFNQPTLISEDGSGTIPSGGSIQICEGNTVTFEPHNIPNPENFQYNWFRSGTLLTEKSHEITVSEPGMYFMEIDYGQCTSSGNTLSNTIELFLGATQNVSIDPPTNTALCAGDMEPLQANLGGNGLTYTWYRDNEIVAGPQVDNDTFLVDASQPNFAGNYTVEIESATVCPERSEAIAITAADTYEVTLTNDSGIVLLPGQTRTLSISTTATTPIFQWFRDDVAISGATNATLDITTVGNYFNRVTETAGPCGTVIDSELTEVVSPASFEFLVDYNAPYTNCETNSIELALIAIDAITSDGSAIDVTADLIDSFNYQWLLGNSAVAGGALQNLEISDAAQNGDYVLEGTLSGFSATSNTLEVRLLVDETLEINSPSNVLCGDGHTITLSTTTTLDTDFSWIRNGEIVNTSDATLVAEESGTYELSIQRFGCEITSNAIVLTDFDPAQVQISTPDTIFIVEGDDETVIASGAETYQWFDSNNILLSSTDSFTFSTEGEFLLVAQIGECTASRLITVAFRDNFNVPNVITVNGDGINDLWVLPNVFSRNPDVTIRIFNSRGQVVFEDADYSNNWPESTTAFSAGSQIFYYKIQSTTETLKQGTITVIR